MNALNGARRRCAIPGHPPHPPCVVCDHEYASRFVCEGCRADEANSGWRERSRYEVLKGESTESLPEDHQEDPEARERLGIYAGRRMRPISQRTTQILQLAAFYHITVAVRPRGKARARHEWVFKRRHLHMDEIAFLVGVTRGAVDRTLRRYEPLMRAVLSSGTSGA